MEWNGMEYHGMSNWPPSVLDGNEEPHPWHRDYYHVIWLVSCDSRNGVGLVACAYACACACAMCVRRMCSLALVLLVMVIMDKDMDKDMLHILAHPVICVHVHVIHIKKLLLSLKED